MRKLRNDLHNASRQQIVGNLCNHVSDITAHRLYSIHIYTVSVTYIKTRPIKGANVGYSGT